MATEILKKQTIVGTDAQYEANRNSYGEGTVFESTSLLGESDIDPTYTNKFVERKVSENGLYAYCFDTTGITKTRYISEGFPAYSLVERDEKGRVRTADPEGQNDATTKKYVDDGFVAKKTTTNELRVYAYDSKGDTSAYVYYNSAKPWSIVQRDASGCVKVADPEGQNDAVNKEYADANYVPIKPSNFDTTFDYDTEGTYCFAYNGKNKTFTPKYKDFGLGFNTLPIYNDDATLTVTTPAMDGPETLTGNAASDTFVYNNFVLSEFGHTPSQSAQDLLGRGLTKLAYVADFGAAGDNVAIALSESPDAGTIAVRTSSGQLSVTEPTETSHAANKGYVDNRFRYTHLIEVKFNPAPEPYVSYVVIGTITYTSNSSTPLTSIDQLPANVALPIHGKYQEDPTHFYETYTATRKTRSNGTSSLDITYLYYSDSEGIAAGTSGEFVPTSFTDTVV